MMFVVKSKSTSNSNRKIVVNRALSCTAGTFAGYSASGVRLCNTGDYSYTNPLGCASRTEPCILQCVVQDCNTLPTKCSAGTFSYTDLLTGTRYCNTGNINLANAKICATTGNCTSSCQVSVCSAPLPGLFNKPTF